MTIDHEQQRQEMNEAWSKLDDILNKEIPFKEKIKTLYHQYKETRDVLPWYKILGILMVYPFADTGFLIPILGIFVVGLGMPIFFFYTVHPTVSLFTYHGWEMYKQECYSLWKGPLSLFMS